MSQTLTEDFSALEVINLEADMMEETPCMFDEEDPCPKPAEWRARSNHTCPKGLKSLNLCDPHKEEMSKWLIIQCECGRVFPGCTLNWHRL